MLKNNIQHRIILGELPILPEYVIVGRIKYEIKDKSFRTHLIPDKVPIGVAFTGFTGQYILEDEGRNRYETYIYFYKKLEGDWCAVIDAMEEII